MSYPADPSLQRAIDGLSLPGVLVGHRLITAGDEQALLPEEQHSITATTMGVRRASGAARLVARALLARLGFPGCALPRTASGAPGWPAEVTGSLAHDARVAVAAVAMRRDVRALGIDVEPAELLPPDLLDIVATDEERRRLGEDPYRGRLLFAAKEATYKAVYPLDQQFLDFPDIAVDLAGRKALVRNGRVIDLHFCCATHLVVLALVRSTDDGAWRSGESGPTRR